MQDITLTEYPSIMQAFSASAGLMKEAARETAVLLQRPEYSAVAVFLDTGGAEGLAHAADTAAASCAAEETGFLNFAEGRAFRNLGTQSQKVYDLQKSFGRPFALVAEFMEALGPASMEIKEDRNANIHWHFDGEGNKGRSVYNKACVTSPEPKLPHAVAVTFAVRGGGTWVADAGKNDFARARSEEDRWPWQANKWRWTEGGYSPSSKEGWAAPNGVILVMRTNTSTREEISNHPPCLHSIPYRDIEPPRSPNSRIVGLGYVAGRASFK